MNRSEIPHWPTESSTGWCTTRIASRCVGTPCVKRKERRRKSERIGGPKAVEKTGEKRPWKSQERFPLSHSFNNNKLDDRDHFQQNAKTSVASLRGLIGSSRNIDRHHSGMLIAFIGIPTKRCSNASTGGQQCQGLYHSPQDVRLSGVVRILFGFLCRDYNFPKLFFNFTLPNAGGWDTRCGIARKMTE